MYHIKLFIVMNLEKRFREVDDIFGIVYFFEAYFTLCRTHSTSILVRQHWITLL